MIIRWPAAAATATTAVAATSDSAAAAWRGLAAARGVRVRAFVSEHRDVLPTLLDAAGFANASDALTAAEAVDGRSLLDVLRLPAAVAAADDDAYGDGDGDDGDGSGGVARAAREKLGWREWIELEHDPGTLGDVCFPGEVNHWNALTDGRWKCVRESGTPRVRSHFYGRCRCRRPSGGNPKASSLKTPPRTSPKGAQGCCISLRHGVVACLAGFET